MSDPVEKSLVGLSVLVVDDESLLCRRLAAHLEALGADVTGAETSAATRRLLQDLEFDFVLLEVHSPDGLGTGLLKNGAVCTGANGGNWVARISGTSRWLNDVTYEDGTWFLAGNQGTLLATTNFVNWTTLPLPTIKSLYGTMVNEGRLLAAGIEGIVLRNQIVPQLTPVNFLGYDWRIVTVTNAGITTTNSLSLAYELFLLGGEPDQFFEFQSSTNLSADLWTTNAIFELYDASGTLYVIRSRNLTNVFPSEFYRTSLVP